MVFMLCDKRFSFYLLAHSRGTTALFFRLLFYYTMTAAKTTTKLVKKGEKPKYSHEH